MSRSEIDAEQSIVQAKFAPDGSLIEFSCIFHDPCKNDRGVVTVGKEESEKFSTLWSTLSYEETQRRSIIALTEEESLRIKRIHHKEE